MFSETIKQIEQTVLMASLLGAPTFGADDFLAAAKRVKRAADKWLAAKDDSMAIFDLPDEYGEHIITLKLGAEAAAAYIACQLLPTELAEYRAEERGAAALRTAQHVAAKYSA